MSRLRHAFYTFWYVSRWHHLARVLVILGCGLFLIGGGIYSLMKPYLPDELKHLDFNEVMGFIEKSSPQYISFEAELDFSKKIYWTGWAPYWGHCPPDQIYQSPPLDAAESEFKNLVGCRVMVKGSINPNRTYRLTREVIEDKKIVGVEQVDIAPIDGTKDRLWVKSAVFKEGEPYEKEWLSKTEFPGVLATYEQVMKALPTGFPRNISYSALPWSNTFVIYSYSDTFYDEKTREHFSSHYWVPVKGSGNSLFVWVTQDIENNFTGSITGVLEPRDRSDYKTRSKGHDAFSVVTGETLPARYGLIQYRTAAEYNDAEHVVGWPFILFGSLIVGAGLFGLRVYIVAPRLIFDAWKKAFESVREQWRHHRSGV